MRRRRLVGKIGVGAVALSLGVSGCSEFVGGENEATIPLFVTNYDGMDRPLTAIWRADDGERGRKTVTVPARSRIRIADIGANNGVTVEIPTGFSKGGGPFWNATSAEIYLTADDGIQILPSKSG
ncbi:hypothetical protein [Haladaptatus sp.]|uniref:hypothetical protein n=1 Tax=Haladaptatus sp. TaxID=1973141 RepID=UPI003C4321B4